MDEDIAIRVENVSKDFVLPHEKVTSVKGAFTGLFGSHDKARDVQHALKDLNFEIKKGEFFGIVGRNGSGKSTMLKILAGIYQPTKGKVYTRGKLVPFIELGVGFNPELTGRENVFLNGAMLGFSRKEIAAMYDDIVSFAELERFMDQKLKNYSSGMQVRLAFSMATRSEADILLIDEVLAVGDAEFQRKCFDFFKQLKKDKRTVVFVSHDMNAVREYCDRAILLEENVKHGEGSADEIARMYSKLFIKDSQPHEGSSTDNRWGSGQATFVDVRSTKSVFSDESMITITTVAKSSEHVMEDVLLGFRIRNAQGSELIGTNSRLLHHKPLTLYPDKPTIVEWTIPNIFNDGNYSFDPALTLSNGDVCEWWDDAVTFKVKRESHTSYLTAPNGIALKVKAE